MLSTFLVYAVIPLGIILVIGSLAFAGGDRGQRRSRYRPGRPYTFEPVWFLSAPKITSPASAPALEQGHSQPQLAPAVFEDSSGQPVLPGPTGGASDRW